MSPMNWQRITNGWWWLDHGKGRLAEHEVAYHADVNVIIWPAWRFSVCQWIGWRPVHGVARGWRFGFSRTVYAAERAIKTLVVGGAAPSPDPELKKSENA